MAKIKTASYIEGISGKVCNHSQDEYRTNSCSGMIVLCKKCNPYVGEPSAKQTAQRNLFKNKVAVIRQWLADNRAQYYTSEDATTEHPEGSLKSAQTALYDEALQIKKNEHLSNITQAIALYQSTSAPYTITLPSEGGVRKGSSNSNGNENI